MNVLSVGKQPEPQLMFGAKPPITHRMNMPSASDTFTYANGEKTTIETLIGGGQVFGKIDEILNKAKSVVLLDLYNFQDPKLYPERLSPPGTPGADIQSGLMDRVIELKKNGAKVKVILDNSWDARMEEGHNDRAIAHMRQNGVDVVTYPDFAKINHVKVLIVDNKFAVIGGMNWGNHSAANHDAALFIEGPDVRNLINRIVRPDWEAAGRDPKDIPNVKSFDEGRVKVMMTSSKESPEGAKDEIYTEIIEQIGKAKDSIYAELFVLTQKNVIDNLIFAHKRLTKAGKEGVKILVDPGLFFAFKQCRPGIQKLARAGVPIQFYSARKENEEKLHAKWAVFDKETLLMGSANWSNVGLLANGQLDETNPDARRISRGNHETAVSIKSKKIAAPFVKQVQYDWEYNAFPIMEQVGSKWRPVRPGSEPPAPNTKPGQRLQKFA